MPLEVLATAALPEGQLRLQTLAFSRDGATLLAGVLSQEVFDDQLRVSWIPWEGEGPERSVALPHDAVGRLDGSVTPIDLDGAAVALASANFGQHEGEQELWLLTPQPRRLIHTVEPLCFAVAGDGKALVMHAPSKELWLVSVETWKPVRKVLLPTGPACATVSADRSHFAWADRHRVVCIDADGEERCAWPGSATRLVFAPDDLGLWGLGDEAITWFPWKADPVPFGVPELKPWDLDAASRRALFANRHDLAELDLGTGAVRHHGPFRTGGPDACDPARRRVARLEADDRFRVCALT